MKQGYITLATGSRFYLELAINLALSIKLNDPARPICVVIDEGATLPEEYRAVVDVVAHIAPKPGFHGCLNKLRIHEISPFEETMFVDSDCIVIKRDMDRHWAKFSCPGFSIAGGKVTTGNWYGFSISKVIEELKIGYMVKMNSGVFYFRKGQETDIFFQHALKLVETKKETLGTFHRNKLQLADEPFIGATLGALGATPLSYLPEEGSIMITTVSSSESFFDPFANKSHIIKHSDFRLLGRFLPKTNVRHSPSIAHFVRLKPKSIYAQVANGLRTAVGIAPFKY